MVRLSGGRDVGLVVSRQRTALRCAPRRAQLHNRGSPGAAAGIREDVGLHPWMPLQDAMDDSPEHALPLAVDDAHLLDTALRALLDVVGDELLDVGRGEGVQVEHSVDRQLDRCQRFWVVRGHGSRIRRFPAAAAKTTRRRCAGSQAPYRAEEKPRSPTENGAACGLCASMYTIGKSDLRKGHASLSNAV